MDLISPFSIRVQWKNLIIHINLSQFSTSLFETISVKKLTAVSKSALDLLIMNNNFSTTNWNSSLFPSNNCSESSLKSETFLVAGDDTDALKCSPNIVMQSSNCLTISTCNNLCLYQC